MSNPTPITDDEVGRFLNAFALRFDGYKYAASRGGDDSLRRWTERFVATLRMAPQTNVNHAAFFALQHFLGKWGGEMLSIESREHLAYRLLFLHLYRAEVPAKYALADGRMWLAKLDLTRLERVAARVREQLIALTLKHGDPIGPGA